MVGILGRRVIGLVAFVMLLVAPATAQTDWSATFLNSGGDGYCTYTAANFSGIRFADQEPCSGLLPLMSDLAYSTSRAWQATSLSSHGCSPGLKTFVLATGGQSYGPGTPVRVVKDNSYTEVMDGVVTAFDAVLKEVTVKVDAVDCSGTSTDWHLYMASYRTEAVASPLTISDGGTGSSHAPGARSALGVPGLVEVLGVLSIPPGSPSAGDAYLIGPAPTLAWSGRENDVATWSGAAWEISTPAVGDHVVGPFVPSLSGLQLAYKGLDAGGLAAAGIWWNSQWAFTTHAPEPWPSIFEPPGAAVSSSPLLGDVTLTSDDVGQIVLVDLSGSSVIVTLPRVGTTSGRVPAGRAFRFLVVATGAATATIQPASGGQINGAASIALANAIGMTTVRAVDLAGLGSFDWYTE